MVKEKQGGLGLCSVQLTSPTYLKGMNVCRKNSCADVCVSVLLPSPCLSWEQGELGIAELAGCSIAGSQVSVCGPVSFVLQRAAQLSCHGEYPAVFQGQQYSSLKQLYPKLQRQRDLSKLSPAQTLKDSTNL